MSTEKVEQGMTPQQLNGVVKRLYDSQTVEEFAAAIKDLPSPMLLRLRRAESKLKCPYIIDWYDESGKRRESP